MKQTSFRQASNKMPECIRAIHCQIKPLDCHGQPPNAPEGLFECIEKEPESTCLYRRLFLDYTYGLGKIYTAEEFQAAKASPSFERV
jgi:hypothetical protein